MDRPLLEITSTPARYEYEVMRARLEMSKETKPAEQKKVSRASSNMKRQAGRFEMNTVRRRSDMGSRTSGSGSTAAPQTAAAATGRLATMQTASGGQAAQAASGDYSEYGSAMARTATASSNVNNTVWGQSMQHSQGDLVLMPLSSDNLHYVPAGLAGDFEPGDTSMSWNVGKARLDFVPSTFSMNFTQYASISIEYTGGFNYVPASADPNYEGRA